MSAIERAKELGYPDLPEPLELGTYDNHTHIEIGFGSAGLGFDDHITLMKQAGMLGAVQVGVTLDSSKWCAEVASVEPTLLAAVALHPNEAAKYESMAALGEAMAQIAELAKQPRVRAIGETGLDFFRTTERSELDLQMHSFEEHIEIAKENNLALMIHDRDAHDDVVATLKRVGAPERVVFHCYSGDLSLAQICADNGWYMSFAGNITIKRNQHLRDSLAFAPRELILIETDAPFLTPEPLRGRPNAPYLVPVTLRFMAGIRGVTDVEMAEQLNVNTQAVYGSWAHGLVEKPQGWQPPPAPRDSSTVD